MPQKTPLPQTDGNNQEAGAMTLTGEPATTQEAIQLARQLFLRDDNRYGCAETALVALQILYDLPAAEASSAAMVLNGGVAYSGGICGAISGAALAVGRLSGMRIADHSEAKRTARLLIQSLITEFEEEYGGHNCADLIDYDISIPAEHDRFIESGVWKETCMAQVEFSVARLNDLADPDKWQEAIVVLTPPIPIEIAAEKPVGDRLEGETMPGTFISKDDIVREQMEWGEMGWLSRPETTGATQLVAIDVVFTPGGCHDFHKHPGQEEVLYVISGTLEQWIGEEKQILTAGDTCFVPKGVVHASFNDSNEDARLVAIIGPCVGDAGYVAIDVASEDPWASLRG